MPEDADAAEPQDAPLPAAAPDTPAAEAAPLTPPPELPAWRVRLEENALWVALGALALAGVIVFVGVQVAPETFYDNFWWEDIYGPLVVDAHQCRTAAECPGLGGPSGVTVKDGYTVTSELTYGLVLAVLLYGIYVGLFRKYNVVADSRFVLALLPWILLGPLARALEDANIFCKPGTDCDPNVFAFVFISPVIYIHIALYVIAFMLLGVFLERRRHADARLLSAPIAGVLALGFALYAFILSVYGHTFHALPPLWFVLLTNVLALGLFYSRAKEGNASLNLTLFTLGLPWALGCIYLIGRWLLGYEGGIWVPAARDDPLFVEAGLFIAALAVIIAGLVFFGARGLVRSGAEQAWGRVASRLPEKLPGQLGWAGAGALLLFLVISGAIPVAQGAAESVPAKEVVLPVLGIGGFLLIVAFALLHVGQEAAKAPGVLLIYAVGINVALVLGHMIDGIATWVALEGTDLFGLPTYSEKHPFSDFLLRFGGGALKGFGFPIAKLLMVLVVVWVLDRETARAAPSGDAAWSDERNLVGLVKMAIFVLGFAPGLRDLLRLSMGV